MILYINNRGEIKDIDSTKSIRLNPVLVADNENPFLHWSKAKILCHRIELDENGKIKKYMPYIDSNVVNQIDQLSKENESLKQANASTQAQLDYVTMMSDIEI